MLAALLYPWLYSYLGCLVLPKLTSFFAYHIPRIIQYLLAPSCSWSTPKTELGLNIRVVFCIGCQNFHSIRVSHQATKRCPEKEGFIVDPVTVAGWCMCPAVWRNDPSSTTSYWSRLERERRRGGPGEFHISRWGWGWGEYISYVYIYISLWMLLDFHI